MAIHLIRLTLAAMLLGPFMPDGCGPPVNAIMRYDGGGTTQASSQSHFATERGTARASSQSHFATGEGTTKASSQSHF